MKMSAIVVFSLMTAPTLFGQSEDISYDLRSIAAILEGNSSLRCRRSAVNPYSPAPQLRYRQQLSTCALTELIRQKILDPCKAFGDAS